jgi:excisionase family DNA binding protein
MHRHCQFDIRENPASDRRHGARASAENTVANTFAIDEGQSQHHDSMAAVELSATSHAGPKRPATGEGARKVTHWNAFRLPLLQSDRQFERLLRSEEAAKLLGDIHVKTLQRYARQDKLPAYRIGGHWYFRASELDAWLSSRINSSCHPCRLNQEESDGT